MVVVTDEGREFHNEIARWKNELWSTLVRAKGKTYLFIPLERVE